MTMTMSDNYQPVRAPRSIFSGSIFTRSLSPRTLTAALLTSATFAAPLHARSILLAKDEVIDEDGYNRTYDDPSKSFKDRMKEARAKPELSPANEKGGFYLGVLGAFGPVYNADSQTKSGMGFQLGVDPGYLIQGDSFSRVEVDVGLTYSKFDWSYDGKTYSMSPLTILPRFGWGYSMGQNLYGAVKLGFGFATGGEESFKTSTDVSCKSDNPSGLVLSGDYDVVYASGGMQFVGGMGASHYKFSHSEATCGGVKLTGVDYVTNINFVNLHGGVRFQF
jgi:hypothetical protein